MENLTAKENKHINEGAERRAHTASKIEPGDLITSREASAILGIALGTLYNKVRRGEIPKGIKLPSGRVRFSAKSINEWIQSGSNKQVGGKA